MSPALSALTTFAFVAASVGGVLLALFLPTLAGKTHMRQRRELALGMGGGAVQQGGPKAAQGQRHMRRSVEETLRELEKNGQARSRWRSRTTLRGRLREAGLEWSPLVYSGICVVVGLAVTVALSLGLGVAVGASAGFGLALGVWLPHAYIARQIKQRRKAFTAAFPDAVDIVVRGVRSGIPLTDCLHIVATESPDPVRSEFRTAVEDLTMGLAVDDAIHRMSERVALEEARFFSIVITIQSRTGGNLSEALGNLSIVLRDRAKMRGRIRAMSSEAKASAWIIGSLPPVVCVLVFLTSPDYVGLLFSTFAGNVVLAGSALWMLCGIAIMRQMINFDF